ncbi:hypothetical protein HY628_02695 [Candidatus Uhrbacteria bacterium]|nr:hypothetical protein [Candidatus Uhrbacteria bacterium]
MGKLSFIFLSIIGLGLWFGIFRVDDALAADQCDCICGSLAFAGDRNPRKFPVGKFDDTTSCNQKCQSTADPASYTGRLSYVSCEFPKASPVPTGADCRCTCLGSSGPKEIPGTVKGGNSCDLRCTQEGYSPGSFQCVEVTAADTAGVTTFVGFGVNPLCPKDTPCTIPAILGRIVRVLLGIVGSIALIMFIYGGFLWMTARGDSDQVKKARDILVWASLGLMAIFASYAAVKFIVEQVI